MRQAIALKLALAPAPHPLAGKPVLESAPLRPGYKRSALSRFEDNIWDLSPAVFRENARICQINAHFEGIDPSIARTLREFLYARLNFDIPGHRNRLPPASIRDLFIRTRRFLEFLAAKKGICNLATVDQAFLENYRELLTGDPQRSPTRVAHLLEVVFELHHYREYMPSGGLDLLPWKGRSPYVVAGARQASGENKTPRLPEGVISPLLRWSLKYITFFSTDILAARAELETLKEQQKALIAQDKRCSQPTRRKKRRDRLAAYLEQRRTLGRGVPTWTIWKHTRHQHATTDSVRFPINSHLIHLHIGVDPQAGHVSVAKETRAMIRDAIAALGEEIGGMDTAISVDPDTGKPWRPRFDTRTVLFEERMLQAACYVVCAYLTGMRDCEVQAMRTGCVDSRRSEDGIIERYQVKSTMYKWRYVRGQPETWTTIEPVAKAIGVLERLTGHIRRRHGGDTIWRVLAEQRRSKEHVSAEIVRQLNAFRDHLNAMFGTPEAPVVPPGPNGKPWHITTRQFRRTIAWHIANRPFGTVAGMIQYKHASIAAYEGYAGSSGSGFRNEVERERALGQLDDVLSYFERHRTGEVLTGPAAARITGEMQQALDKLDPLPGHIADPARVRLMLTHVAKTLFVGLLSDCFFDPSTALCLNGKTDRSSPSMAQCRPDRCPNSCITSRHRPLWEKALADGVELLRTKRLSRLQREAIEADIERYRNALRQRH